VESIEVERKAEIKGENNCQFDPSSVLSRPRGHLELSKKCRRIKNKFYDEELVKKA